jgi:hypothetical protein
MSAVAMRTKEVHPCNGDAGCERCRRYKCAGCQRWRPWSDGAADDMPDHCDACWAKAHTETVATLQARRARLAAALAKVDAEIRKALS